MDGLGGLVPSSPALSDEIQKTIREVVKEWVAARRMFTAFEVSLAAKERGVKERHRNMKNRVHEIVFEEGSTENYTRMLMDVGAPEQAWLYYGVESDPYTYTPLDRNAFDSRATPPTPTSDSLAVVGTAPLVTPAVAPVPLQIGMKASAPAIPDGAYGVDRRGRLSVPVEMLRKIKVGPREQVNVVSDLKTEELILRKRPVLTVPLATDPIEESDTSTCYTAEKDGNVRVTQRTLSKAKIAGLACYKIEEIGDGEIRIANFNKP